jgi:hypothetical protein
MIPPPRRGGRPRKTSMRAAVNAISTCCAGRPWRYLPRDHFPLRSTVYNIFRKFPRDGIWEAIWVEPDHRHPVMDPALGARKQFLPDRKLCALTKNRLFLCKASLGRDG